MPAPFEVEFKLRRKFKTLLKNKLDQTKSGINEDAMGSNADNAKKFQNITKEIFDFLFDKSQIAEGKLEIKTIQVRTEETYYLTYQCAANIVSVIFKEL